MPFPISQHGYGGRLFARVVESSPRRTAFSSFASRALNPERTSDLSTSILLPRRLSTASILALSSPRMETNSALCWRSSGARKSYITWRTDPITSFILRHSSSPPYIARFPTKSLLSEPNGASNGRFCGAVVCSFEDGEEKRLSKCEPGCQPGDGSRKPRLVLRENL